VIETAKELKTYGWDILGVRAYLRFNYPCSTCSAIEEAIKIAFGVKEYQKGL
jgi:hypothetical protein